MTYETLRFGLGAIVGVAVLWLFVVRLGRFLSWVERSEIARQKAEALKELERKRAAAPPPAKPEGIPPDHLAVIAGVVAACTYKVVHIEDVTTGPGTWAAEGRLLHQTSHITHITH